MTEDWRRRPGQGDYARPERERRFLLNRHPCPTQPGRLIEDRYLRAARLRLRRLTVGSESVFKLTQKVRTVASDPSDVALTSIYLDEHEFQQLAELPSSVLMKTRRISLYQGSRFAVDEFHGALDGLLLAEVEVSSLMAPMPRPDWLDREVTHDDRYSGGSLAALSEAVCAALLDQAPCR